MSWKRLNYLLHRWTGIVLGLIVFVWFASGIVMMYYPYPELTPRERLQALPGLELTKSTTLQSLEDVQRAWRAAVKDGAQPTAARLRRWNGHLAYALYAERGVHQEGVALVDAESGTVLSPISATQALDEARASAHLAGAGAVELLPRSDHYFMGSEKKGTFPVYRVQFADPSRTAVYVAARTGEPVARVTRWARISTWLGTVPHWLYFQGLYYDHFDVWLWLSILLPGASLIIAMSGMVLGVIQLFPRRRRGSWRVSAYHGMSVWHHLSGIAFGALVFTWTLSGMLEVLGPSSTPGVREVAKAAGDPAAWASTTLDAPGAYARASAVTLGDTIVAVDFVHSQGRAGYLVHLRSSARVWVDAITGAVRRQIDSSAAEVAARAMVSGAANVAAVELLHGPDAFYYAKNGGELVLPVWRVRFDDPGHTAVYLDPVTGMPAAIVTDQVRQWRWWREGLHDFDFPGLVNRRPLWDILVLVLMVGGVVSSMSGVWLLGRRLWRLRPDL
ncbi:MAG: PepSY domain-containing protein [Gemmatimonadaceae bacterium]